MAEHPDMLAWFSKPEEALNKRLNKTIENTNIIRMEMH